jgi:hypothetical protein
MVSKQDERWLPWHWDGVEKVLKEGGSPSRRACAAAIQGTDGIPAIVRDFLAKAITDEFPPFRPTLTVWENETARLGNWVEDAAWEFAYRWTCCKICKRQRGGISISQAIEQISEKNKNSKNSLFHEFIRPDLEYLFAVFISRGPYPPSTAATKKRDNVISDVAGENKEHFAALSRRINETAYRKSKPELTP